MDNGKKYIKTLQVSEKYSNNDIIDTSPPVIEPIIKSCNFIWRPGAKKYSDYMKLVMNKRCK